jgi:hypothetical protein
MIIFNGQVHPIRTLKLKDDDFLSLIASEELEDMLFNADSTDYTSDDAMEVDDQIRFYVPLSALSLSDDDLESFLTDNLLF